MEVGRTIELLADAGTALGDSAESAGLAAPVPSCPDWAVRDLLAHVGVVHRWAATIVAERCPGPTTAMAEPPEGEEPVAWYRHGHRALVDVLTSAPPDAALEAWRSQLRVRWR